jgi:hypothetical protein
LQNLSGYLLLFAKIQHIYNLSLIISILISTNVWRVRRNQNDSARTNRPNLNRNDSDKTNHPAYPLTRLLVASLF